VDVAGSQSPLASGAGSGSAAPNPRTDWVAGGRRVQARAVGPAMPREMTMPADQSRRPRNMSARSTDRAPVLRASFPGPDRRRVANTPLSSLLVRFSQPKRPLRGDVADPARRACRRDGIRRPVDLSGSPGAPGALLAGALGMTMPSSWPCGPSERPTPRQTLRNQHPLSQIYRSRFVTRVPGPDMTQGSARSGTRWHRAVEPHLRANLVAKFPTRGSPGGAVYLRGWGRGRDPHFNGPAAALVASS